MNDRVNRRAIVVYLQVSTSRQDLRSQEPKLQTWLQTNPGEGPVVWYCSAGQGVANLGFEDDSSLVAAEGGLATLGTGKAVAPLASFVKLVLHGTGAVGGQEQTLVGLFSLLSHCG